MNFLLYIAVGFFSGLLGGMGMGGGTVLIPVLTIFFGVGQHVAQAANLISFLPMAAFTLKVHSGNGFVRTRGLLSIILPALVFAVGAGFIASYLPAAILKKAFGAFLIFLAAAKLINFKFNFSR